MRKRIKKSHNYLYTDTRTVGNKHTELHVTRAPPQGGGSGGRNRNSRVSHRKAMLTLRNKATSDVTGKSTVYEAIGTSIRR